MTKTLLYIFLLILSIACVSADVVMPGYKPPTPVENIITNINEFPDYIFVGIYFSPRQMESLNILSYALINTDGKIPTFGYYGHGVMSGGKSIIYAIRKEDIKLPGNRSEDIILLNKTLSLGKAIKVIENISFVESSSVIDFDKKITREYVISLEDISGRPDNVITERSPLIYFYYGIPVVGIIILLYILVKRRKNAN